GNIPAPRFRVYASGDTIDEDSTWCRLRNYFASRDYKVKFQNPGTNLIPERPCTLCHSADHPRGLCPFPSLTGWNGPTWKEEQPLTNPERRGGDATLSRDRNRAKMARTF
ncbi:hypothetical protein V8E52_007967, partial [Russula decolorans]